MGGFKRFISRYVRGDNKVFLKGNLNDLERSVTMSFKGICEGHGLEEVNVERKFILDFFVYFSLTKANTYFRKRDMHLIIYKNEMTCSQKKSY